MKWSVDTTGGWFANYSCNIYGFESGETKKKCLDPQESNHKAPSVGKKPAPWIVRIKYTISWNKEQQSSIAWFFPSRFFWSLFFPQEITVALFSLRKFKITSLNWISFGKTRPLLFPSGRKGFEKNLSWKNPAILCCSLFPSIPYFLLTILSGAVFFLPEGALILHS